MLCSRLLLWFNTGSTHRPGCSRRTCIPPARYTISVLRHAICTGKDTNLTNSCKFSSLTPLDPQGATLGGLGLTSKGWQGTRVLHKTCPNRLLFYVDDTVHTHTCTDAQTNRPKTPQTHRPTDTRTHINTGTYTLTHPLAHTLMHTLTHTHSHPHPPTRTHIITLSHTHTNACTHTRYTHAQTHTYTHTMHTDMEVYEQSTARLQGKGGRQPEPDPTPALRRGDTLSLSVSLFVSRARSFSHTHTRTHTGV